MAMSRKHFVELARIAALVSNEFERTSITLAMSAMARQENSRFDGQRFRDAVEAERSKLDKGNRTAA